MGGISRKAVAIVAFGIAAGVLTPGSAKAVLVDTSSSATFSFDFAPIASGPFSSLGFNLIFGQNTLDAGEILRVDFFNESGSLFADATFPEQGPSSTAISADMGPVGTFSNTRGFLVIAADSGSFDVIPSSVQVTTVLGGPGSFSVGMVDAHLVTSVPEPAAYALFGIALVGLGFSRRKHITN